MPGRRAPKRGCHHHEIEDIPDKLWDRLRVVAAQQNTTMRAIVVDAIERAVGEREDWQRQEEALKPAQVNLGPARSPFGPPY